MTVYTYPDKTGVKIDKEVIIASDSDSALVSATDLSLITKVIPAHSIGINGFLTFDLFSTRTGSANSVIVLVTLNGSTILNRQLGAAQISAQTRFIIYADHSTIEVKTTSQSFIPKPYYKGFFADKVTIPMNIEADNDLTIGVVVFDPSDTVTIEGYCIRTFNPSLSKNTISGKS